MQEAIVFACLITVVMWLPYLAASAVVQGVGSVLGGDPKSDLTPLPAWATRLRQAHANAAENLAAFVGVCFAASLTENGETTVVAVAFIYTYARIAHYLCYGFGVPFFRTLSFIVSWLSIVYIGISSLGLI
ncbi:MAG: MAPEG family protein [Rhodobiaceae bacterium]|nr:MAPEG family protein [Rhodobiaceae bacterium]MCR9242937.1 MAPEG family protein [Rhodobiaceae bacterium]